MIFWREAWLQKVLDSSGPRVPTSQGHELLWARLKTSTGLNTYFCQASELSRAAPGISRRERFSKCFGEIAARNCTTFEMAQRITIWLFWRVRRLLFGPFGRGTNKTTPAETLHLKAGELVQVRSMPSISQTLNSKSFNRGLWFSPEMRRLCGTQQRVAQRIDKLIVDGTGEMRQLHDTVYLEGSMCGCAYVAFGGCSRCEFNYWREIWLRRPSGSS